MAILLHPRFARTATLGALSIAAMISSIYLPHLGSVGRELSVLGDPQLLVYAAFPVSVITTVRKNLPFWRRSRSLVPEIGLSKDLVRSARGE